MGRALPRLAALLVLARCLIPAPAAADGPPANEKQAGWVYCGCDETEAFTVLVVEASIPGVGKHVEEMPLRRCRPDEFPDGGVLGKSSHADGRSKDGQRGTGLGTSLWMNHSRHPDVRFTFSAYWTADDGTRGDVSKSIVAPFGRASEHALGKNVTLSVSFRAPEKRKERADRPRQRGVTLSNRCDVHVPLCGGPGS